MVAVGLKKPELRAIFRLVAAMLHLGNITFTPVEKVDEDHACMLENRAGTSMNTHSRVLVILACLNDFQDLTTCSL